MLLGILNKSFRNYVQHSVTVLYYRIQFFLQSRTDLFRNRITVFFPGVFPTGLRQFLLRAVNMRLESAGRNRNHVILYHIRYLIRIIDYKFLCPFARPGKIGEHFISRFKIERRLLVGVLKAF